MKKAKKIPSVKCWICGKVIPKERVKFLLSNNVPIHEMTTVNCSQTKRKKGVYMGEVGTSEMKIVDKVYSDSVRDIFRKSAHEIEEDEPEEVITTQVDSKMKKHYDDMKDEEKE